MKEHYLLFITIKRNPLMLYKYMHTVMPTYIPFPGTSKIPHKLQSTERLKQTLGRRIGSIMEVLTTDKMG